MSTGQIFSDILESGRSFSALTLLVGSFDP